MIELIMINIIKELGATGVLILGLYWILYKPLRESAKSLSTINEELGELLKIVKKQTEKSN